MNLKNPEDYGNDVEYADLFDALSGSYGSLASVLSAEVKLVKAEKFVKLSYHWYREGLNRLERCSDDLVRKFAK